VLDFKNENINRKEKNRKEGRKRKKNSPDAMGRGPLNYWIVGGVRCLPPTDQVSGEELPCGGALGFQVLLAIRPAHARIVSGPSPMRLESFCDGPDRPTYLQRGKARHGLILCLARGPEIPISRLLAGRIKHRPRVRI
jgi:hypothetical protein